MVMNGMGPYFVKKHSDSKSKYTEEDNIKMLEFLVDNIFVVIAEKGFPTDNRHSPGYKLCPSSSRHMSVLIRSEIHTVFALGRFEMVSISVQLHI